MNFLQTIWNAMTTENEMLINFISLPMLTLELTVSMLLFTTILNIKSNKNQRLLYIFVLSIIGFINILFIPTPYNTFINIVACPVLVYFIFKTNILKSILAEIIPYIFFVVLSSLLITFYVKINNLPSNNFLQIPLYKLCFSLVVYFIVYIFYIICKKNDININLLDKMKKRNNLTIFINFIIRYYSYSTTIIHLYYLY